MSRKRSSSTSDTQKKVTFDDELQRCSNRLKELVIENSDIKKHQKEHEKSLNNVRKEMNVLSSKLKKNNKSISLDDIKLSKKKNEKEKKKEEKEKKKEEKKKKKEKEKEKKMEEKVLQKAAQKRSKEVVEFDPKERAVLIVSTNDKKKQSFTRNIEDFFIDKLGFQQTDILKISDPKKLNILDGLDRLIEAGNEKGCKELWFLYSGDGILIKNLKQNDIEDVIVPSDYKEKGVINAKTFDNRLLSIKEGIKFYALLDCCHDGNFLSTKHEYCGSIDMTTEIENSQEYSGDICVFSLRTIEQNHKGRGVVQNQYPHLLCKTFIEHYGECVDDNLDEVSMISMLHDIRDYMIYNEIEVSPILGSSIPVLPSTRLLTIKN
uniref:Uncharacterized protein n=1 Tax=viral metagenome TaxID=1070528 RepID=A0A6C0J4U7_9ZZZZ